MAQQAFFIGPYEEGWTTALKPWLISDKAFASLKNAYVWRSRIKKRVGSHLFRSDTFTNPLLQLGSRLRIALSGGAGVGITDGAGNATGTVPGTIFKAGQFFSIGTTLYTVQTTGTPVAMLRTDGTTTANYNTTTGAYTFAGAPATTQIYWYPAEPVMGIANYEDIAISDEPVFAFDTQFAYQRSGNAWERLGAGIWTGSNSQFFWTINYRGTASDHYYLFVVNNNRADQIKYWTGAAWTTVAPPTRAAANYTLQTARLIVSFKDRLIALNTIEEVGGAGVYHNFVNRARWCQNGNPLAATAWYDNVPGLGGWIEAPTRESIITAQILKDRLLVYFERSTWELVYTGNQVLPFVWQVIDDQLGAESTFSSVLFDKVVFGIGQNGIHACDGLRVERIDLAIPDLVFNIHNGNAGVDRVAGIRDFSTEMVYWTAPNDQNNPVYPDNILAYNYRNGSWALWDDSITAFGYYQNVDDVTWGAASATWEEATRRWVSASNQSQFKNILAGNQEGYTFILDREEARNAPSLQITNMDMILWPIVEFDVIDHNLQAGDFVLIEHSQGITHMDGRIFGVTHVVNSNSIEAVPYDATVVPVGVYTGGGVISRISQIDIKTKQFNFYGNGARIALQKVDFDVDRTENGRINVDFFVGTSWESMSTMATLITESAVGTYTLDTYAYSALYPLEESQSRVVHPVYIPAEGDCVQLRIYINEDLMYDENIPFSPFELNSMTFYASPTARRL